MLAQNLLHLIQRHRHPGGGIGIGKHDALIVPCKHSGIQRKILPQRYGIVRNSKQISVDRIEAVTDLWKGNPVLRGKKRQEGQGQHLIRPIAHKHLLRAESVKFSNRVAQVAAFRFWIPPQRPVCRCGDSFQHSGGGRIRVFICIQLDK